jgi:hypothetical protein
MGLTLVERRAVTETTAMRYRQASKCGKTKILDELCAITGWHRSHARKALTTSPEVAIHIAETSYYRHRLRRLGHSNSFGLTGCVTCVGPITVADVTYGTDVALDFDETRASYTVHVPMRLGPGAVIRVTPALSLDVNVTGGIKGRTNDFTIGWYGTKAYVHFTGTVGDDGMAHGWSSGTTDPVSLGEGTWDSVGPLTC